MTVLSASDRRAASLFLRGRSIFGLFYRQDVPCSDDLPYCSICGYNYERFNSLASHLANDCPARQSGLLDDDGQEATMAKHTRETGGLPDPGDQPSGDYSPFLRAIDLGKKVGTKGKLTFTGKPGRKVDGNFGTQIVFPVKFHGKDYDFGVNVGSGNHNRLFQKFGKKIPKGTVNVELKVNMGKSYIAIVDDRRR